MRAETIDFFKEGLAGAGAVLYIVSFTLFPMLVLFSIVIFLAYQFAYWVNPDDSQFICILILFYSTISAYWLYPKIKDEINKNKKGL